MLKMVHKVGATGSTAFNEFIIQTCQKIPPFDIPHSETATIISRFGLHLTYSRHHNQAERVYKIAFRMFNSIPQSDKYAYLFMANAESALALNTWRKGDYKAAQSLHNKALDRLYGKEESCSLLEAAEIQLQMGDMFEAMQKCAKAQECLTKARENQLSGCSDMNHPQLLSIDTKLRCLNTKKRSG